MHVNSIEIDYDDNFIHDDPNRGDVIDDDRNSGDDLHDHNDKIKTQQYHDDKWDRRIKRHFGDAEEDDSGKNNVTA